MNEMLNKLDDELFDLAYQDNKSISECLYDVYDKGRADEREELIEEFVKECEDCDNCYISIYQVKKIAKRLKENSNE